MMGFVIPAVVFSVFSGLRNRAGDTEAYIVKLGELLEAGTKPTLSFGKNKNFPVVMWWSNDMAENLHIFDDNYQLFIMITAIVSLVPVIYILYKYSASYELAIALFVYTGYFAASLNGIRQYFAAGIMILATKYLLSEKKDAIIYYLPFLLIAYTIHSSSIIMLPIFFLIRRKSFTPMFYFIIVASIGLTIAFDSFLSTFFDMIEDTSYSLYATEGWFTSGEEQGASLFRAMVAAVPLILSYFRLDFIRENLGKKGDMLINLCLFKTVFQIVAVYNWIFSRMTIYLDIYYIILLVWLLKYAYAGYNRKVVYGSTTVLFYIYFNNMKYMIDAYTSKYIG
ncbi:MAG: EpsG family protein [Clostridiales bacterium]|nr:EpsG family protein [Clostridiales bacterium]